jgi:hypothetical protein
MVVSGTGWDESIVNPMIACHDTSALPLTGNHEEIDRIRNREQAEPSLGIAEPEQPSAL